MKGRRSLPRERISASGAAPLPNATMFARKAWLSLIGRVNARPAASTTSTEKGSKIQSTSATTNTRASSAPRAPETALGNGPGA